MRLGPFGGVALLPYWQVARRSFQRYATYRGATAAGVFTNTLFGFMKVAVLLAVYRQAAPGPGGRVGGFDAVDVATYTFVAQGLLTTAGAFMVMDLGARIRTGDVVSDLYRPLRFPGYWLATDMGRVGFQLAFRGIPPALIGTLFFRYHLPSAAALSAFVVSLGLAALVSFGIRYVAMLSGFWVLDARGPWQITGFAMAFFSGVIVPVNFFPAGLARIARLTPFPALLQTPIEIFLGKAPGGAAAALAYQTVWAVVLLAAAELVTTRAVRKVVVHGG